MEHFGGRLFSTTSNQNSSTPLYLNAFTVQKLCQSLINIMGLEATIEAENQLS